MRPLRCMFLRSSYRLPPKKLLSACRSPPLLRLLPLPLMMTTDTSLSLRSRSSAASRSTRHSSFIGLFCSGLLNTMRAMGASRST
jgi:hypothetical protein